MTLFLRQMFPLLALLLPVGIVPVEEPVQVAFVGDIQLDGVSPGVLLETHPFHRTRQLLRSADYVVANLECPVATGPFPHARKRFTFLGSPDLAQRVLQALGVRVVTLANNHVLDRGPVALADTLRFLDRLGIERSGAGEDIREARRPCIVETRGIRIGYLSYSDITREFWAGDSRPGTAPADPVAIRNDVRALRHRVDHVVVSFHWGIEGASGPNPRQRELARAAMDAGASFVHGSHPHRMQPLVFFPGTPAPGGRSWVAWSMGNFLFGRSGRSWAESGIAWVQFTRDGVSARMLPLRDRPGENYFAACP